MEQEYIFVSDTQKSSAGEVIEPQTLRLMWKKNLQWCESKVPKEYWLSEPSLIQDEWVTQHYVDGTTVVTEGSLNNEKLPVYGVNAFEIVRELNVEAWSKAFVDLLPRECQGESLPFIKPNAKSADGNLEKWVNPTKKGEAPSADVIWNFWFVWRDGTDSVHDYTDYLLGCSEKDLVWIPKLVEVRADIHRVVRVMRMGAKNELNEGCTYEWDPEGQMPDPNCEPDGSCRCKWCVPKEESDGNKKPKM